jgi:cyclase
MLRPRIIPCLLVQNKGLVKTVGFGAPRYVGDPVNAVKIFNEKHVDELIVLDIDATTRGAEPDYRMIEHIAIESRMPLCYGGGIKNVQQAKTIISLGVEKVSLSAAAVNQPNVIAQIAETLGNQSAVVVLDVKSARDGKHEVWTHNGTVNTGRSPVELAMQFEKLGVGEIVLNSIDHDGRMNGYDIPLVEQVHQAVNVPITVLGGARALSDVHELIKQFGAIGAAAGSMFVFKGTYRAVLINYPSDAEREKLVFDFLHHEKV